MLFNAKQLLQRPLRMGVTDSDRLPEVNEALLFLLYYMLQTLKKLILKNSLCFIHYD